MSKIYWQERNHPNWTGRVPRQARITGEYSKMKRTIPVIDVVAVAIGAALVLVLLHL